MCVSICIYIYIYIYYFPYIYIVNLYSITYAYLFHSVSGTERLLYGLHSVNLYKHLYEHPSLAAETFASLSLTRERERERAPLLPAAPRHAAGAPSWRTHLRTPLRRPEPRSSNTFEVRPKRRFGPTS